MPFQPDLVGFLFLLVVVVAITATALIAKLASRNNISALDLSTSLFGVSAVIGAMILWGQLPVNVTPNALVFSAVGGIGGSMAVLAFNNAVRTGHFGFSNAIYRSSFLVPVVFAVLFLDAPLKPTTVGGITLILAGIFFMSRSTAPQVAERNPNTRWLGLILLAFLLSGAPRVGQTLTSACHENYFLYLFVSYLIGAAMLLVITVRRESFNFESLTWGTGAAVASYLGVFCTLKALELLNPHVVFPISLAAPIILGIVLSLFLFREKITRQGWLGVSFGVIGILILAIWK